MTTKHIYFGKYSNRDIEEMGLDKDTLHYHNGNYFEYFLEILVEDGMIRFTDSCGRHMPFDESNYRELLKAVVIVNDVTILAEQAATFTRLIEPNKSIGLQYDPKLERVVSI